MTQKRQGKRSGKCSQTAASGAPCKAQPLPGKEYCRWHSPDPEDQAKHKAESIKGGLSKAYGSIPAVDALVEVSGIAEMDVETAAGLRQFLAGTLKQLAQLPFDTRVANAISSLATAQRALIETSDLEKRLSALEAAQEQRPLRRA